MCIRDSGFICDECASQAYDIVQEEMKSKSTLNLEHIEVKKQFTVCFRPDLARYPFGENHHGGERVVVEQGGCTYAPMEPPLPPMCYSILPSTGEVVQIDRWQKGYTSLQTLIDQFQLELVEQ